MDLQDSCLKGSTSSCGAKTNYPLQLTLVNKGSFTIKRLAINILDWEFGGGSNKIQLNNNNGLKPGEELIQTFNVCLNPSENEVKIIPSINATQDKKEKFCNENALVLKDEVLALLPCSP